jgi:HEAT repeats
MRACGRFASGVVLAGCLVLPLWAQDAVDPIEARIAAQTLCAAGPDTLACDVAEARAGALMAEALAEAGNTRDRGAFIEPVRRYLADPSAEVRTSALYALGKLQPDASDTPAILALLRDPVSNVRAGAWAAASLSGDPVARLVLRRVPERPESLGYEGDPVAFDPAAPGFSLPGGASYLWLTADRRKSGQLEFLSSVPQADVLDWAGSLGGGAAVPLSDLLAADPATAASALGFLDATLFGAPMAVRLAARGDLPWRLVVVYQDIVFGQTGTAVVFGSSASLVPAVAQVDDTLPILVPTDAPTSPDAGAMLALGIKPDARQEETDLFVAILAANGFGAEDYQEIYPDGAYAAEVAAILASPRMIVDQVSYPDTGTVAVGFRNLPPGSTASMALLEATDDYAFRDSATLGDAATGTAEFRLEGRYVPGLYAIRAEVFLPDQDEPVTLWRDFSITTASAGLVLDKATYAPGEAMVVGFSAMAGSDRDYIATAKAGSAPADYIAYVYTDGLAAGQAALTAPTAPGDYEVRAFFRDEYTRFRASVPFTVAGAVAPAVPEPAPTAVPEAAPAPAAVPEATGGLVADGSVTLALNKTRFAPYEEITVTFAGMTSDPFDYVTTTPAGAEVGAYMQYAYTNGAADGAVVLAAPAEPGSYEMRAFFNKDKTILRGVVRFTVGG